jgi:hypothetical protein
MAAGARHGLPAPTTVVSSGPSVPAGSAPVGLSAQAVSAPAGFSVSLAGARDAVGPTAIGGVGAGSDLLAGHSAPVASDPVASGGREPSAAGQPHTPPAVLHAIVPGTPGSRAPPTA